MPKKSRSYWLLKSEAATYAYADLEREGRTAWTGVRNFQARNHLRAMQEGDEALFYHSVKEKEVAGVARVVRTAYPDPTAEEGDWSCVDLEPVRAFSHPVTLDGIKAAPALGEMVLLKNSRLSVQPVTAEEWQAFLALAKADASARPPRSAKA